LRMLEKNVFDLGRADQETGEPQRVAKPGKVYEATLARRVAEIAAPEPTVGSGRRLRRGVVAVVADHPARHLEDELARRAMRQARAGLGIACLHFALGSDQFAAAERALFGRRVLALARKQRLQLARAVESDDLDAARAGARRQ